MRMLRFCYATLRMAFNRFVSLLAYRPDVTKVLTPVSQPATAGELTTLGRPHALLRSLIPALLLVACCLACSSAPALAAESGACPNEALRTELNSSLLPECRAYEMVSTPFKDGQPLLVAGYAGDGEEVVLHSLAGIAGTPGSGEAATESNWYLATRTAGGWRLSGMNAPLSEFVGQVPDALEAKDGLSLWTQHTPQQAAKTAGLYVRSADGEYSSVGTLSSKAVGEEEASDFMNGTSSSIDSEPIAAISTYAHIVIRAGDLEAHWPFDHTTAAESLYEYSGANNKQPVLVATVGSEKGSDTLLAPCGAAFGSGRLGSAYNALSRDGEMIFFTLEPCSSKPAELYARLHGALASPGAAESVDVGESECSVECGEVSGKNFEGASENGEKVFFTSTQKLTNNASDLTVGGSATEEERKKPCAHSENGCNLYEFNFALPVHERLKLVAGDGDDVRGVAGIAEDGARVYFVADGEVPGSGENEFHRKPVAGKPNLFVHDTDTGVTAFIATLSETEDSRDWERTFFRPVEVAGEDGRFLLFVSAASDVTADETSNEGVAQLFEYDAETGELVRVTQGEDGYDENGNGVGRGIEPESISTVARLLGELHDFKTAANRLNVARDGKTVVFETADALSERATGASARGCTSVYEFSSKESILEGKVHLLSDGRDTQLYQGVRCGATFQAMDEDGANVLIFTADPLLTSDVDGVQPDVYDVRVVGGFAPSSAAPECEGERCLGAVSSPPGTTTPGSSGQAPEASPVAPATTPTPTITKKTIVKCGKGKKLSQSKCVKAKAKKKAKKANSGRRASR